MGHDMPDIRITDVKVLLVESGHDGLLAWGSCVISGAIRLNNIAIRRGSDGALFLTYPNKNADSQGRVHSYFHPISKDASKVIEDAVLARLATLAKMASGLDHFEQAGSREDIRKPLDTKETSG